MIRTTTAKFENHIIYESVIQVFLFYRDGIKTKKINIKDCKTKEDKFINFLIQNILTAIHTN